MDFSRREALGAGLLASVAGLLPVSAEARGAESRSADIGWLGSEPPALDLGQTFGVAWPEGALTPRERLAIEDAAGTPIASQQWTLATWPDGSPKWTAFALPPHKPSSRYRVVRGAAPAPERGLSVRETADMIWIRSGDCEWSVPRSGNAIVREANIAGRQVVGAVRLIAEAKNDPDGQGEAYVGEIERVSVEQRGPVRAVVKIDGKHKGPGRAWLPFSVRLYAYAGSSHLRIVHSFIFDGGADRDFISALGIRVDVPMSAASHDRHIRFALGEDRLFAEAVRPLTGLRSALSPDDAIREAQVAGRQTPSLDHFPERLRKFLPRVPQWGDFTLAQLSPDGFTLRKRTGDGHGWIDANAGRRAPGLAYAGQPTGGAALAIRYFRERYPTQLDVRDADKDTATLTGWLWSPEAPAMDLRPYHGGMGMDDYDAQNEGLAVTYEDYEPGWDSAHGIARTSELTLWACAATPASRDLLAMAAANAEPAQLMATPEHLHAAGIFGDWSLPDRSTPVRAAIEDQLDRLVDFYAGEVERRSWYGFWNHGDVMHTYDFDRHQWRYDIGGFAWDNSELSTDLWLWYAALRSGDLKTWRLAEAMTRHTGEVDVYHMGRFAGLGTRHGVQHWSDSSKQPRVSTAAYRRIFYYLTADERVGDLMRALVHSDRVLESIVIERKVPDRDLSKLAPGQIDMSFGTVWCSLAAAWLTEWERTGNRYWRDRLIAGMDSIARMPGGWRNGYGIFDLKSGRFVSPAGRVGISHLNSVFGAVEINSELIRLLDVPQYRATWLDYCRFYNAPKSPGGKGSSRGLPQGHSRLTAYAAQRLHDAALAARAAEEFATAKGGLQLAFRDPRVTLAGGIVEWPDLTTNTVAQWGLAAIQNLALVPEALDRADYPGRSD